MDRERKRQALFWSSSFNPFRPNLRFLKSFKHYLKITKTNMLLDTVHALYKIFSLYSKVWIMFLELLTKHPALKSHVDNMSTSKTLLPPEPQAKPGSFGRQWETSTLQPSRQLIADQICGYTKPFRGSK